LVKANDILDKKPWLKQMIYYTKNLGWSKLYIIQK